MITLPVDSWNAVLTAGTKGLIGGLPLALVFAAALFWLWSQSTCLEINDRTGTIIVSAWLVLVVVAVAVPLLIANGSHAGDRRTPCGVVNRYHACVSSPIVYDKVHTKDVDLFDPPPITFNLSEELRSSYGLPDGTSVKSPIDSALGPALDDYEFDPNGSSRDAVILVPAPGGQPTVEVPVTLAYTPTSDGSTATVTLVVSTVNQQRLDRAVADWNSQRPMTPQPTSTPS